MKAWIRNLSIVLTSHETGKRIVIGENHRLGNIDLEINVSINKYMSVLKDVATVTISNLTYSEVTQIVMNKFYDIDIYAGYRSASTNKIFSGGVLYISNQLESDRTNTIIILCTSQLVARYGQTRINLTLNSGINTYTALKYICKQAGIKNSNVSKSLKQDVINEVITANDTITSWIDKLASNNNNYIVNSDSILDSTFSIFDASKSNNRVIVLNENNITLTGGYPKLTNEGLTLTCLPTFNFMCGDVIKIDNALIDVSVSSKNEISSNYASYLNNKGEYLIYEIKYILSNRGNSFMLQLTCKNREKISNYVGN